MLQAVRQDRQSPDTGGPRRVGGEGTKSAGLERTAAGEQPDKWCEDRAAGKVEALVKAKPCGALLVAGRSAVLGNMATEVRRNQRHTCRPVELVRNLFRKQAQADEENEGLPYSSFVDMSGTCHVLAYNYAAVNSVARPRKFNICPACAGIGRIQLLLRRAHMPRDMNNDIFTQVDQYINGLFIAEDEVLRKADASVRQTSIPANFNISANQGKFLQLLARLTASRKILELGTLVGYSTIWLAQALPSDGLLISLEYDPGHAEIARKNLTAAGVAGKVQIRVGKALDNLPKILAEGLGPFDLIFIDADKPPYTEYFEWALRLSRKGTLIIADNVIREGAVLDPDSADEKVRGVSRFNNFLAANPNVTATIIQNVGVKGHDGMALAVVL